MTQEELARLLLDTLNTSLQRFVLSAVEVDTIRVRFRVVAKARGVTASTLWRECRREIGFRNYDIPRAYADRVLAWVDAREPINRRLDWLLKEEPEDVA